MKRKCIDCEGHGVKREYLDRAGSYKKYHCKSCLGTGEESTAENSASVIRLYNRIAELELAVRWALGENGTFPDEPPPVKLCGLEVPIRKRFWWRSELRRRAGL